MSCNVAFELSSIAWAEVVAISWKQLSHGEPLLAEQVWQIVVLKVSVVVEGRRKLNI